MTPAPERIKFNIWLTREEHRELAGASKRLAGTTVYRDQSMSMQAIVLVGMRRELGKLAREHNDGEAFPHADATRGAPRRGD